MRLGDIPHSNLFEVMRNTKTDALSDEIDLVVYAEFADAAALEAYKAHPIWADTTATVRPMRELRYSADAVSTPLCPRAAPGKRSAAHPPILRRPPSRRARPRSS